MEHPLFAFGTLRDPDVVELVLGRTLGPGARVPARMPGFRIARVPDETYPVLLAAPDDAAPGEMLTGLGERDWARIAFFEGEEYAFRRGVVEVDGRGRRAVLYCAEGDVTAGASECWTLAGWQREDKASFLETTARYMALFERASLDEADALWQRLRPSRFP